MAALKDAVAARDATIKRLEGEIGQAKADVVGVVNSSGSEREKMLAAQSPEASEKVMSLEKELESAVAKLDGAMRQGAEAEMAVARAESAEKEGAWLREQLEGKAQEVRGLEGEVRSVREEMEAFSKANGSEREAMLARELGERAFGPQHWAAKGPSGQP